MGPDQAGGTARHRPKDDQDRWRFLIVSAWERPIGIVPLQVQARRRVFGVERVLTFPRSPWGMCPGPVGPHPAAALTAAIRHLVEHDDSWDRLELPEATALGAIQALKAGQVLVRQTERTMLGWKLPATFSQFWADRDAAARQRWRELEARRSLHRNEQFVRFRPGGAIHGDTDREWDLWEQLEHVVECHTGTPQHSPGRQILARLRDLHALAVDAGCADIAVWLSDSRPAAFAYNFSCRSRVETVLLLADPCLPHATDRLLGLMLRDDILRGDLWHVLLPHSLLGTRVDRQLWAPLVLTETIIRYNRRQTMRSRLPAWLRVCGGITSKSHC